MSCSYLNNQIMSEFEQRGRKHFNTQATFIYGAENELIKPPTQNNPITKKSKQQLQKQVSSKYGDWWLPISTEPKESPQQSFHGKNRHFTSASDKVEMTGIAGFSLGVEDEISMRNNKSAEKQYIMKGSGDLEDEGIYSENSFVDQHIPEDHSRPKHDEPNARQEESQQRISSTESVQFAGEDLVRKAQARALVRQKSARHESDNSKDELAMKPEKGQKLENTTFTQADPREPAGISYGHTSGQQFMHLTQKQILEQRMAGSQANSYAYQPPWYTTNTDERSPQNKGGRISLPANKEMVSKRGSQRSSNQIDFPLYTTQEIIAARPLMIGSRNEKCSWLPNLAPDFDTGRQAGKLYQKAQENPSKGDVPIPENSFVESKKNYTQQSRMSAPYASHE